MSRGTTSKANTKTDRSGWDSFVWLFIPNDYHLRSAAQGQNMDGRSTLAALDGPAHDSSAARERRDSGGWTASAAVCYLRAWTCSPRPRRRCCCRHRLLWNEGKQTSLSPKLLSSALPSNICGRRRLAPRSRGSGTRGSGTLSQTWPSYRTFRCLPMCCCTDAAAVVWSNGLLAQSPVPAHAPRETQLFVLHPGATLRVRERKRDTDRERERQRDRKRDQSRARLTNQQEHKNKNADSPVRKKK